MQVPQGQFQQPQRGAQGNGQFMPNFAAQPNMWQGGFDGQGQGQGPEGQSPDSWSTGSAGQPVPTTLNVEDW